MKTLLAGIGLVLSLAAQPSPPAPSAPPAPPAAPWPRLQGMPVWTTGGSFLGVGVAEINAERAKTLNLRDESGVEVTRVEDNSPAFKAGIQRGDVILNYNGQRVEGIEQLQRLIRETPAGRNVKLEIGRNGSNQTLTAVVEAHQGHAKEIFGPDSFDIPKIRMPDFQDLLSTARSVRLGIETESLGPQLAEYFGVRDGVLVRTVMKNSPAERAGIRAGDVILKVDKTKVATAGDILSALRSTRSSGSFPVDLKRDRKDMTVSVSVEQARSEEHRDRAAQ